MTDRELLELAAKAVGYERNSAGPVGPCEWNPLTDDGDALRLAVHLELETYTGLDDFGKAEQYVGYSPAGQRIRYVYEPHGNDPYAATRRAITRAAAEIGKQK